MKIEFSCMHTYKLADEDEFVRKEFLDWYENDAKKLLEQLKRERMEREKEKKR